MSRIEGWTEHHAQTIQALIRGTLATADQPSWKREIAEQTGGLPVYADLAGSLVITPAGDVLLYSFADNKTTSETDRYWLRVARISAAEQHRELASLMPVDGTSCQACGGTGKLGTNNVRCGACGGSGKVASVP